MLELIWAKHRPVKVSHVENIQLSSSKNSNILAVSNMNAIIFNNKDVTHTSSDQVISYEEFKGEHQGRFVVAKIANLVTECSSCSKTKENWNYIDYI